MQDWVALADAYYDASMGTDAKIPVPVIWGTDAVHGHSNVYGATIFPHNIGLGAAHDVELIERIAEATGQSTRATGIQWAFAPTLAVVQDPRWGRSYESFSSDPMLVRAYAKAYIAGMQGDLREDGAAVATAKHFIGDGATDAAGQLCIVRGAQADVVREQRRAHHVVVAVHGIGAPDDRHRVARIGRHRCLVVAVGQVHPVAQRGVLVHARP